MAEGEAPRVVGEFSNYEELINSLRNRASELNLSGEQIDRRAGVADRYTEKLLRQPPIRRLGAISLGPFLGALAVRGLLIEDRVALEKLRRQTTPRDLRFVRAAPRTIIFTVRYFKKIGRLGAQARINNSTEEQRREWARAAANARWQKGGG